MVLQRMEREKLVRTGKCLIWYHGDHDELHLC